MMEETIDNMKPVDNSSTPAKSAIKSENPGIKWISVPYQLAIRSYTFILSVIFTVYPLLNRFLTFIMSIQLTVNWYYNFMHHQHISKVFGYTLIFICGVVLLSDLVIDDEETE